MTEHHELCGSNWGDRCNCPVENEQRPSNQLAARARARFITFHEGCDCESCTEERDILCEIERLTAELADLKAHDSQCINDRIEIMQERDAALAERDRLRAALELIQTKTLQSDSDRIAREALAGAADETYALHMDTCQLKYGGNKCTCGLL